MAQIKTGETYQSNVYINFFSSMKFLSEEQIIVSIFYFGYSIIYWTKPGWFCTCGVFFIFHGAIADWIIWTICCWTLKLMRMATALIVSTHEPVQDVKMSQCFRIFQNPQLMSVSDSLLQLLKILKIKGLAHFQLPINWSTPDHSRRIIPFPPSK